MPVLYTKRDIDKVLRELHIKVIDGRVNAEEAARILSWRAKREHKIDHEYTPTSVRKHREKLNPIHPLKADGTPNTRANLYQVEKLFNLAIEPKRTNPGRYKTSSQPKEQQIESDQTTPET